MRDSGGYETRYTWDKSDNLLTEKTYNTSTGQEAPAPGSSSLDPLPGDNLETDIRMAYNNINLVNEINRAGSITRLALDGYGNPLSITDPSDNAEETIEHDPLYRLARATDSLGGSSALSHSRRDQTTQARPRNSAATSWIRKDFDEITEERSPDRGRIRHTRDEAGNILTRTDARGITATYTYDSLNRPLTITYPDTSENTIYTWDSCRNGKGRLCRVEDASGETSYEYDTFGNTTSMTKTERTGPGASQTFTTTMRYNNVRRFREYLRSLPPPYQCDALETPLEEPELDPARQGVLELGQGLGFCR